MKGNGFLDKIEKDFNEEVNFIEGQILLLSGKVKSPVNFAEFKKIESMADQIEVYNKGQTSVENFMPVTLN